MLRSTFTVHWTTILGICRPIKPIYKSQACPLSEKRNADNHLVSEDNTFKEPERYISSSCVLTSILYLGEKTFSFRTLISPRGMKLVEILQQPSLTMVA
ncbi:hCG2030731, partial [Homo sapiens]|uniref:Putative uncharacterized protein POPDC1-AS1 n=1 Tax=Homo sapiens TaxID=9606 RepID=BVAS1_HUMAN